MQCTFYTDGHIWHGPTCGDALPSWPRGPLPPRPPAPAPAPAPTSPPSGCGHSTWPPTPPPGPCVKRRTTRVRNKDHGLGGAKWGGGNPNPQVFQEIFFLGWPKLNWERCRRRRTQCLRFWWVDFTHSPANSEPPRLADIL